MRSALPSVAITAAGVALLGWLIWSAGPQQIWGGLRQVGWGLIAIIAIAGLRFGVRAVAWRLCLEPPHRLRLGEAFTAVLCGDALGNATPLGPLVSEPAKVAFVRERVPVAAAFTALAIENVFYTLSVAAMLAAGTIALLLRGGLERDLQIAAELGIAVVLVTYVAATWALMRRPALLSRAIAFASRLVPPSWLHGRIDKVRRLEQDIYTFMTRRRQSIAPIVGTELTFHVLGVLEFYLTLWLLLDARPSLVTAFILETANRLITVLFKFVPMQQAGVNDAGTVAVAQALGLTPPIALTLAIVKRARMVFWQLAGTALVVRHGMTARRILADEQLRAGQGVHHVSTRPGRHAADSTD